MRKVILTGLRANNDLHIGNYLGALLPIVDIAIKHGDKYQINLFVPDLHSFITPVDHSELQPAIMQNLRVYVAAGLPFDNKDIYLYRQSYIPAHSELAWILDCFVGMGEMSRMTQYKDKAAILDIDERVQDEINGIVKIFAKEQQLTPDQVEKLVSYIELRNQYRSKNYTNRQAVSVGLFNYPVLMAADILLYGAAYVPVGDDQTQHLELTRDIAIRMNNRFGNLFVVPEEVKKQHEMFGKDQGLRIRDLVDPLKKMSKSDSTGKGVIFLSDTPEVAHKKIMGATTDSYGDIQYDYKTRPGISNLLDLLTLLGGNKDEFLGQAQYGGLKQAVSDKVALFLQEFQAKLSKVDDAQILDKLESSELEMNKQANTVLLKVQKVVGLR